MSDHRRGRKPRCTCGACATCVAAARKRKKYHAKTPEQKRAMVKRRDPISVFVARTRATKKHERLHPERASARKAMTHAIRSGRLIPQPCEFCGSHEVQGHHPDYSRPLDVRWLCTIHHAQVERGVLP